MKASRIRTSSPAGIVALAVLVVPASGQIGATSAASGRDAAARTMRSESARSSSTDARSESTTSGARARVLSPLGASIEGSIPADRSELPVDGRLTLSSAVALAVAHNMSVLLGEQRAELLRGESAETRSLLLPNVEANASQQNLDVNLAAQGFTPNAFPGLSSTLLGPFNRFDARLSLVQSIFNLSSIRRFQAGRSNVRIADLQLDLARQQVVEITSLAYVSAISAARSVDQARANFELAQSLEKLARDQHEAGVATGLDVTRASTRVAQERLRLAEATNDADVALSRLERIAGIPQDVAITLADPLVFMQEALPPVAALIPEALQSRLEVQIAGEDVSRREHERQAAQAEQLPSLDVAADYGPSGNTPVQNDLPTRGVAVRLNVPIFNGGLTRGHVTAARALERQAELQLGDVRGAVEQDVRLAVLAEATAAEQVSAAAEQLDLAEQQLRMARDRFSAGVASNIEVTEAQTALADARQAQVDALARHAAARIEVAAARGIVERFHW